MWNVIEVADKKVLFKGETYKQCLNVIKDLKEKHPEKTYNVVVAE